MCNTNGKYPFYELPRIDNLVEMMIQKAIQRPNDIAFAWYDNGSLQTITYNRFYEQARTAAEYIRKQGLLNCNIGVWGNNSYQWLLTFMSIIYSRNVAIPLDKDMDLDELMDVYRSMDICCIFAEDSYIEKAQATNMNFQIYSYQSLEFYSNCNENKDVEESFTDINSESLACIFLTSGTTGKRKGVMLSHLNLAEDINESCRMFELTGNTLAVLPFHHSFGLIVAVWMVFNYGYIVYISQGLRRIQKELVLVKPQTMMLVPLFVETFYKQLTYKYKANQEIISDFFGGNLEYIICGGAPLDKLLVKAFRSFGIEILNGYGTTECSPVAAVNRNLHHKDGTVGFCIPGTKAVIAEDGEVLISGNHVMMGYYNELEETRLVLHDGWYHTGDIGTIDEDGFITLTGRKKNLIILSSGENICPEEIEERLLHIRYVDEVIVTSDGKNLKADIYSRILDSDIKSYIETAVNDMNRTLPWYKHINQVSYRDCPFEKTTSQKIIRR